MLDTFLPVVKEISASSVSTSPPPMLPALLLLLLLLIKTARLYVCFSLILFADRETIAR